LENWPPLPPPEPVLPSLPNPPAANAVPLMLNPTTAPAAIIAEIAIASLLLHSF
jgi:hypothetical protein